MTKRVCVAPDSNPALFASFCAAVEASGAELCSVEDAEALIWADPQRPEAFPDIAARAGDLDWVQLPYAGIEPFVPYLYAGPVWTCGKGVYAQPVAELALSLMLAGRRRLWQFIAATSWQPRVGENLIGTTITVLGGGGIAEAFLELVAPFECTVNVVRRSSTPLAGAARTVDISALGEVLPHSDIVLIAWPLTEETERFVNRAFFGQLPNHAWIVNVGRGAHIDTDDLINALETGTIGGAALDVTDPEPLPDGHRLWEFANCIITPHVGNTAEMGVPLITARVRDNVARFVAGEPLVGTVDLDAGY